MEGYEATTWEPVSLHEITQQRGEQGLLDELTYQLDSANYEPQVRDKIDHAVNLMRMVHEGQMRDELPYTTHTLRVALRILIHFEVTDPDVIIASLLHDSVEDRPGRYFDPDMPEVEAADPKYRAAAFERIKLEFGDNVRSLVAAVTNPLLLPGQDKQEMYHQHVLTDIAPDPRARIIKLSDIIDNAKGLKYNPNPDKVYRLAGKYDPVLDDMLYLAQLSDTPLPPEGRRYAVESIKSAKRRCRMILLAA